MQAQSHRAVAVQTGSGPRRRLAAGLACLAAAAILTVLAAPAARAVTVTSTYMEGSDVDGMVSVTYSDSVQIFSGPFQDPVGDRHWTVLAGMTINASATNFGGNGRLAWMQAVTVHTAGAVFSDPQGNVLAAPWPDTPPGGYITTDIFGQAIAPPNNRQVFDMAPWYGNNTVGQSTLFDQPKEGLTTAVNPAICDFEFETWLVCVVGTAPPNYNVIPLMGFTWGYRFQYGTDVNGSGVLGDATSEYRGSILFGGLEQGGQPSAAFENGYAKYFNINYLENNDANATLCVPEPMTAATLLMAVGSIATYVRGRRAA
jgi:hypothetical protein